jgi:DNA primase
MKSTYLKADDIKKAILPASFYQYELPNAKLLRPAWNVAGLCPFHDDRKPGSFHVNLKTGAYICFACGSAGGDIIAFMMDVHRLSFTDALNELAKDWGLA